MRFEIASHLHFQSVYLIYIKMADVEETSLISHI